MATFPALIPSEAPITPGAWPATAHVALNGAEASIRHGSAQIGGRWRPRFANITEANFLAIVAHYTGQRSGFDAFVFDPVTLAADRTPAGCSWLYAGTPQVVDHHADLFTVECEFRCEPRGLVVVPGAAWRTGATVFTPGARDGGIVYGPLVAWVTAATVFTPGARFDGVSSNAGARWVTAATTFTPGSRTGAADPYFSSNSLLLHMDGANNSTTFTDSSSNNLATSSVVNAKISTNQSKFGGSSGLFASGSQYIRYIAQSLLQMTGAFTVEAQLYPLSSADMIAASSSSDSNTQIFRLNEGAAGRLSFYLNGTQVFSATAAGITANIMQHVAICREDNGSGNYSTRMFVEGTQIGSTNTSWTGSFRIDVIGAYFYNGGLNAGGFDGHIDELRITKGVARYTANFTPPSGPFSDA